MRMQVLSSEVFGDLSRYRIEKVRTRFDTIEYMVFDADLIDPVTGRPDCIRQNADRKLALADLI